MFFSCVSLWTSTIIKVEMSMAVIDVTPAAAEA